MARIAFVQNLAYEYLGVMYLSASLKEAGHSSEAFILERSEDDLARQVLDFHPDLVAFSCTTGVHHWAEDFAEKIKRRRRVLTVFGGPHPTFFPNMIEHPPVDVVCRGEGEQAIVEMANRVDAGEPVHDILNCSFKLNGKFISNELRPLIADLDSIPNPDRMIYRSKYSYLRKTQAAFMAGRGCPHRCTFCFNHSLQHMYRGLGSFVRFRNPEKVVDEIVRVAGQSNVKTVYLQDDTLFLNKRWLAQFAGLYGKRVRLPMLCLVRADQVSEESIAALRRAGLKNVFFGIECGDEAIRNGLLKKGITDEDVYRTARLLRKYSIRFRTYNMVGLPNETMEQALRTVRLNAEIRTDFPWCSIFRPFPGTELGRFVEQQGLLTRPPEEAQQPSFFKDSMVRSDNSEKLANLQKLFYYGVKFPWLIPLIKRLVRLPSNRLFDLLFLVAYAISLYGSENLTIREVVSIGLRNVRNFFGEELSGGRTKSDGE
jgi:anaerobic magnesium-protoporphyrin IX monomethyl ester cyclase